MLVDKDAPSNTAWLADPWTDADRWHHTSHALPLAPIPAPTPAPSVSQDERERWDQRYATGDYTPRTRPSPFLEAWLERVPVGRALDVATGTGRNALRLAAAGFDVDAVDISTVALDRARTQARRRGLNVRWVVADLDEDQPHWSRYDLVTVFRYHNPRLWPRLQRALAPGGWIVAEHHLRTHLDVAGPPDEFRLAPGELLDAFGDLRVVHYSEQLEPGDDPESTFALARVVACDGDPGW